MSVKYSQILEWLLTKQWNMLWKMLWDSWLLRQPLRCLADYWSSKNRSHLALTALSKLGVVVDLLLQLFLQIVHHSALVLVLHCQLVNTTQPSHCQCHCTASSQSTNSSMGLCLTLAFQPTLGLGNFRSAVQQTWVQANLGLQSNKLVSRQL